MPTVADNIKTIKKIPITCITYSCYSGFVHRIGCIVIVNVHDFV